MKKTRSSVERIKNVLLEGRGYFTYSPLYVEPSVNKFLETNEDWLSFEYLDDGMIKVKAIKGK